MGTTPGTTTTAITGTTTATMTKPYASNGSRKQQPQVILPLALIRENYGVRWVTFTIVAMLIANLGDAVVEFAGIGAAFSLFSAPIPLSCAAAALAVVALRARVGTVGTTITPWGQAFTQSYVADKGLSPHHLRASHVDIGLGALLTNLVAGFIVVACAATLWAHGQTNISSAADAAKALGGRCWARGRRSSSPWASLPPRSCDCAPSR
jgi:Mn2+/Fe2+ NRAMP family transporter